ncbi:MAG: endonuclease/exonuclease/phosphatase family protein [Anaerolineae bacterium]|nr:endonuclease/exonuclease/phosphatase family protein [Anaerolineae bacterium]
MSADSNKLNRWAIALVALVIVMTLQLLRAYGVFVINNMIWWHDWPTAIAIIGSVMLVPLLIPLAVRLLGLSRALLLATALLALARLGMQLVVSPRDISPLLNWLGMGLALSSWGLLLLWLRQTQGRLQAAYHFVVGLVLGLALDTALFGAYLTWDYIWQTGPLPLLTAVVVSAAMIFVAWQLQKPALSKPEEAPLRSQWPMLVLLPVVMGYVLYWQNVSMINAALTVTTAVSTAMLLVINAGVLVAVNRYGGAESSWWRFILALAGALLTMWLLPIASGVVVVLLVIAGQLSAALLLHEGLVGRASEVKFASAWRTALLTILGSLMLVGLGMLYYVRVRGNISSVGDVPLLAGIALLVLMLAISLQWGTSQRWRLAPLLPLVGLVVSLLLILTRPTIATIEPTDSLRVISYNTHYSLGMDGFASVERIAQVIEEDGADVVLLQEMSRGRINSGSTDMAEWLSQRLGMNYVYAPFGDYQQGVVTLSRVPIGDHYYGALPMEYAGEQRRYLLTEIPMPDGDPLRVINAHLTVAWLGAEDRMPQFDVLLDLWNDEPRTLIAGDFNTYPGNDDIEAVLAAGLVSAQDTIGDPQENTVAADFPTTRYDWILVSPEIELSDFVVVDTTASDHRPVAVTITVP